jgi:outer membrane protein insertion porin family
MNSVHDFYEGSSLQQFRNVFYVRRPILSIKEHRWFKLALIGLLASLCFPDFSIAQTTVTEIQKTLSEGSALEGGLPNYDKSITVYHVYIEGNTLVDEARLRNVMTLRPGVVYSKTALQNDLKRIYELGYFTEQMKAVPKATRDGIVIYITLEENSPVTGIEITGNQVLTDAEIEKIFADQIGLPQNIEALNAGIAELEKKYVSEGYILAKVVDIADTPEGTLLLKVDEGVIESIKVVGNRKTKDFVVTKNLVLKTGDVYNDTTMNDDLKRLFSLQAFDDVRRVLTPNAKHPEKYDLVVEVDEKRSGAFSLGGGIDTITGFFGSVGYSDPNFLGRGENLTTQIGVGSGIIGRDTRTQARTPTYQVDLGWSTPYLAGTDNAFSVNLFGRDLQSFNVPLALERRIGGGATISRAIQRFENVSASLGLKVENVALREGGSASNLDFFNIGATERARELGQGGTFVSLGPTIAYDNRNNRYDPTSGWFNTASIGGTLGFGADSYGTASVNLRKYFALNKTLSLAWNGQLSSSLFNDIPDFNAFRLGGPFTVRGYQEGGLGIGSGQAISSIELRSKFPLFGKMKDIAFLETLRVVGFMDAGTLFNESQVNTLFGRKGDGLSVGAGIRLTIPGVGPLRFDYAVPLIKTNRDYQQNFSFGVGQKF